jgi:hypothetical protein
MMRWYAGVFYMNFQKNHQLFGARIMSKEQKSNREDKKKPTLRQ